MASWQGGAINVSTMVDMSRCLKRVGADNSEFSARWRLRRHDSGSPQPTLLLLASGHKLRQIDQTI
ncbi:Uncharacterised protein [Raoultella ornithinolytica]|nr:Uncharacterised protein [Raoultella ornithinolytica]